MTPILVLALAVQGQLTYPIVDTNQRQCYGTGDGAIAAPAAGEALAGQDAQHEGAQPHYQDNGDGTVTDLVTGLMWLKAPLGDAKQTFADAKTEAGKCSIGGHSDWRLPTIKELYSLIDFSGGMALQPARPYINTDYFSFKYGDESKGERAIDSQYWSATEYVGRTMRGAPTVFGVNFADGRIKGYPRDRGPRGTARMWTMFVRGNPEYGVNKLVDNGDGTVTDQATGLMWAKADSGKGVDWPGALSYAEGLELGGHSDWRLPNAKELQSLVDYTHSPLAADEASRGPAISGLLLMTDPNAYFWSSTTHLEGRPGSGGGAQAVYVAFGPAMGFMSGRGGPGGAGGPGGRGGAGGPAGPEGPGGSRGARGSGAPGGNGEPGAPPPEGGRPPRGEGARGSGGPGGPGGPPEGGAAASASTTPIDVHGAGAQRSDPKVGDPKDAKWAKGHGPQGDDVRILNYARAVRDVGTAPAVTAPAAAPPVAAAPPTPASSR